MQADGQSLFYIENMQPARFLETRWQRFVFSVMFGLPFVLAGLVLWPTDNFLFALGLGISLFVGSSFRRRLSSSADAERSSRLPFTRSGLLAGIGRGILVAGVAGMVALGLDLLHYAITGALATYRSELWLLLVQIFNRDVTIGAIAGITYGILDGLTSRRRFRSESAIKLVDTLHWSWRAHGRALLIGLVGGLLAGGVVGLAWQLIYYVFYPGALMLPGGPGFGIVALVRATWQIAQFGAIGGVGIAVVFGGSVGDEVDRRTRPNQGMWRTVRNALRSGAIRGLIVAPVTIVLTAATTPDYYLIAGLLVGLGAAAVMALISGGTAAIKHFLMRLILAASGRLPWNLARFLDYAADVILMRKVGGGYVYIHRMLLEHFAAMAAYQPRKRKAAPAQAVIGAVEQPAEPAVTDETILGEQERGKTANRTASR